MGKLVIKNEDFEKAAIQFDRDLLKMPIFAIADTTKYMTMRTGVTGTILIGTKSTKAQFAPYKANKKTDVDLNVVLRPLTTYFGSLNADFDPNEAISTLLGHRASQAMDGELASTVTAREVLGLIGKEAAEAFVPAIWNAVRNPNGSTTKDLFDGFDTITEAAITDKELSEELGNFLQLTEAITNANAEKIFKQILSFMSKKLRGRKAYLFCSQDISDAYNESYKNSHGGIAYNQQYEQQYVEGSKKMLEIVPLPGKDGSQFITISVKENMNVGVDQESDAESVRVKEYAPDTLTYMARMFFGVQFKTVDPSYLLIVKLYQAPAAKDPEPAKGEGGNEGDGNEQGGETG